MKELLEKYLIFSFLHTLDFSTSKKIIKKIYNQIDLQPGDAADNLPFLQKLVGSIDNELHLDKKIFLSQVENHFDDFTYDAISWYEFSKDTLVIERKTFLLSQYLKLKDSVVAKLLNTTEGSVRYRVSECYQKLTRVQNLV